MSLFGHPKLKNKEVVYVAKTIARYVGRGYKIQRALEVLANSSSRNISNAAKATIGYLNAAYAPADAFKRSGYFPPEFIAVVRAATKASDGSLYKQLAVTLEHSSSVKSQVLGMLKMPTIYFLMLVGMSIVMMVYVIPVFLDDPKDAVGTAALLVGINEAISNASWLTIGIVLGFGGYGLYIAFTNPDIRIYVERLLIRIPGVGGIILAMDVSRAAGYLGLLLAVDKSGRDAFTMSADAVSLLLVKKALLEWRDLLASSAGMTEAFDASADIWPRDMRDTIESGVHSGSLANELVDYSSILREEISDTIKLVSPVVSFISMITAMIGMTFIFMDSFITPMMSRLDSL